MTLNIGKGGGCMLGGSCTAEPFNGFSQAARVLPPVPMPGIFGGPASGSQGTKRCSHEEGCGREALPLCAGASGCYSCHATGDAQRVDDVACGALPSCGLCPQPQVKPLDGR